MPGTSIVLPVASPLFAAELGRLAGWLAAGGRVIPLSVVGLDADAERRDAARAVVRAAEETAVAVGATAGGRVVRHRSVTAAVAETVREHEAGLVLIGWQGQSSRHNVFGDLIDTVVGRSSVPLAVVRPQHHPFDRLLLPVSQDQLLPGGGRGLDLAADLAERVRAAADCPIMLVRTGTRGPDLPDRVTALGDRVHHDPRPVEEAVATAARSKDLVVAPVAPTATGLRVATTQIAWAAPESWLLVAVDPGPDAGESLAGAVSTAGEATSWLRPDAGTADRYEITVTSHHGHSSPLRDLVDVLQRVGPVNRGQEWDDEQGNWAQATVQVEAPSATVAVGAVMTALHEAAALAQAELSYHVEPLT